MDDTWWAFVAGIDKAKLLQELPGSASDRRMREQHRAHVEALKADRVKQDRALGPARLHDAAANAAGWTVRYDTDRRRHAPVTPLERDIAAYAARKRRTA